MATNLDIDQKLLLEAQRLGNYKSKKQTVNEALKEFIRKRQQKEIVDLFGTIVMDEEYDYKKSRDRKPK